MYSSNIKNTGSLFHENFSSIHKYCAMSDGNSTLYEYSMHTNIVRANARTNIAYQYMHICLCIPIYAYQYMHTNIGANFVRANARTKCLSRK